MSSRKGKKHKAFKKAKGDGKGAGNLVTGPPTGQNRLTISARPVGWRRFGQRRGGERQHVGYAPARGDGTGVPVFGGVFRGR